LHCPSPKIVTVPKQEARDGQHMLHAGGTSETHRYTTYLSENKAGTCEISRSHGGMKMTAFWDIAASTSETSVYFNETTRRYVPEGCVIFKTGRDHTSNQGTDERMILKWILREAGYDCMDCFHLAQDTDQWRTHRLSLLIP
jgi:hypothetical protein